jgi:adenosylmethionine-8-amino-7-oxononanoate aminotransferase
MPFTHRSDHDAHPPVVISGGEGIYLYGADGRRYIDAVGSWWVSALGHRNGPVVDAVKAQLDKLEHVSMAGFVSEPTLALTGLLGEVLPDGLTKIFYSDNGSTAVEAALKIAIQYHALRGSSRRAVVALGGGYHGDTLGAVSVGSIPLFHGLFHERFKEQYFTDSPHCFRCPAAMPSPQSCGAECMDSLARILDERGGEIAACVFEPMVLCAAGMRVYPAGVLRKIFALCQERGVLMIADEVATGLGRTGKMFACAHAGVTPDIICLSKGMTGGFLPIAVTAVNEKIYEEFDGSHTFPEKTFYHGHTFTGNPLASAAAFAHITRLRELGLPESAGGIIKYFADALERLDGHPNVSGIRHLGFIGAFELVADKTSKRAFPSRRRVSFALAQKALRKGLILRPLGDTVYFMPPFNVTEREIDEIFALTREAVDEAAGEAGDLP